MASGSLQARIAMSPSPERVAKNPEHGGPSLLNRIGEREKSLLERMDMDSARTASPEEGDTTSTSEEVVQEEGELPEPRPLILNGHDVSPRKDGGKDPPDASSARSQRVGTILHHAVLCNAVLRVNQPVHPRTVQQRVEWTINKSAIEKFGEQMGKVQNELDALTASQRERVASIAKAPKAPFDSPWPPNHSDLPQPGLGIPTGPSAKLKGKERVGPQSVDEFGRVRREEPPSRSRSPQKPPPRRRSRSLGQELGVRREEPPSRSRSPHKPRRSQSPYRRRHPSPPHRGPQSRKRNRSPSSSRSPRREPRPRSRSPTFNSRHPVSRRRSVSPDRGRRGYSPGRRRDSRSPPHIRRKLSPRPRSRSRSRSRSPHARPTARRRSHSRSRSRSRSLDSLRGRNKKSGFDRARTTSSNSFPAASSPTKRPSIVLPPTTTHTLPPRPSTLPPTQTARLASDTVEPLRGRARLRSRSRSTERNIVTDVRMSSPSPIPEVPPNPCNDVPGIWLAKVGADHSKPEVGCFVVEAGMAAIWGIGDTSVPVWESKLCIQLLCVATEAVLDTLKMLDGPTPAQKATAVAALETRWPNDGTLFVRVNGGKSWIVGRETQPDKPLDLTPFIQQGANTLEIVQLGAKQEFTFVVYAVPRHALPAAPRDELDVLFPRL